MTPSSLDIPQCSGPIVGSIRPPGSKSITNRALVCAALARGDEPPGGAACEYASPFDYEHSVASYLAA